MYVLQVNSVLSFQDQSAVVVEQAWSWGGGSVLYDGEMEAWWAGQLLWMYHLVLLANKGKGMT